MSTVTASTKCQVVIPKRERVKIGIKPGSRVHVEAVGDHIEIHPVPDDPAAHYCGIFKNGPSLTHSLRTERKADRRREDKKGS
jgi:AbrB family looped-hinge helix DNA binding protein